MHRYAVRINNIAKPNFFIYRCDRFVGCKTQVTETEIVACIRDFDKSAPEFLTNYGIYINIESAAYLMDNIAFPASV